MQAACWMRLLRRIPESQHDKLMIVTSVGIEVSIQTVMRAEDDYFVIRGRLAGSTDTGRIFFVPYDQINYLCINKDVPEAQIRGMYGEGPLEPVHPQAAPQAQVAVPQPQPAAVEAPAPSAPAPKTTAPAPPPPEEPVAAETAALAVEETLDQVPKLNSGIRLTLPRKSGLLQRLRARAQVNNPPPKPPKP
jgi:hypothetical protein